VKYAALLRGINVGGKNMLPMAKLVELFATAGCKNVETYIQSGNVVFDASASVAKHAPGAVSEAIERQFGYKVPMALRSGAEMAGIIRGNPFLAQGAAERELYVYFQTGEPAAAELDARRSPPDEFELRGREIYLRLPNGAGRTKLTNAYFDAQLKTACTARNWATVLRLAAMTNA
jgi:uncharacterized protein (DUF1697 family)